MPFARALVLFVLAMIGVVVAVALLFFRDKTWSWERLAANVGIVLAFGASTSGFPVVHERRDDRTTDREGVNAMRNGEDQLSETFQPRCRTPA